MKKKQPAKSSIKKLNKQPAKNHLGADKKLLKEEREMQRRMPTAFGIGVG